jgi:transcriptional regulator GlxA family with amidase domain
MTKQPQITEISARRLSVPPGPGVLPGGAAEVPAEESTPAGESDSRQKVRRSIHYMAANLNRPLQVATLASQANVSPSHFFALFKQVTGCPPMDYFTRLRMRHAGELLGSTSASVKEVAAALGYDDPFYFSRVFKAFHHVPPSRYRAGRAEFALEQRPPAAGRFQMPDFNAARA